MHMPSKIDDHDWMLKHLKPLMEKGKELAARDSTLPVKDPESYDRGYWTGLKLNCAEVLHQTIP